MQVSANTAISDIVSRIVAAVKPESVILFGSQREGNARPDSDVDLLVIESAEFGPGRSRFAEISFIEKYIGSVPIATDVLVYSRQEVDRFKNIPNHVVAEALKNGKVVYARS